MSGTRPSPRLQQRRGPSPDPSKLPPPPSLAHRWEYRPRPGPKLVVSHAKVKEFSCFSVITRRARPAFSSRAARKGSEIPRMPCFIVPPDLLAYVIKEGDPQERDAAVET